MSDYIPIGIGPAHVPPASLCLSDQNSSTSMDGFGEGSNSKALGKRPITTSNHLDMRGKVRTHATCSSFDPFTESNFVAREYAQETLFKQAPGCNYQSAGPSNNPHHEAVQDYPHIPAANWDIRAENRAMIRSHYDEEEDDGDSSLVAKKKVVLFEDAATGDLQKQEVDAVFVPPIGKSYSRFHQRNASKAAENDSGRAKSSSSSEPTLVIILPSMPSRPLGKPCHKNGIPISPKDGARRKAATDSYKPKQEDYNYKSKSLRMVASSDDDLVSSKRRDPAKTKARARANQMRELEAVGRHPQKIPMNNNTPSANPNSNKKRTWTAQIAAGAGAGVAEGGGRKCRYVSVNEATNVNPLPPPQQQQQQVQTAGNNENASDLLEQCLRLLLCQIRLREAAAAAVAAAGREGEVKINDAIAGGGESGQTIPRRFIGKKLVKESDVGPHHGEIVGFKRFYTVRFEDGHTEHLPWADVEPLLIERNGCAGQSNDRGRKRTRPALK